MKPKYKRIIAMFFAINIIFETISPTVAFALTGGPSQPEVQSFTPIATTDMVNMFSGDFNYNIPLLDVDGYPVNLAYDAGVGNDQEASWVGLGWNINPGTVNRGMRGLPDDFKGEQIHKETSMRANQTIGVFMGLGFELFGKEIKKNAAAMGSSPAAGSGFGSLNFSQGLNFNTYNGYGMDMGAKLSLKGGQGNKSGFSGALGLNSGTGKGLGISPEVSYSRKRKDADDKCHGVTGGSAALGLNYNTVSGLSNLSFNYSFSGKYDKTNKKTGAIYEKQANFNGGFGYSFASPSYMPSSGPEMINMGLNVSVTFGAEIFGTHPKVTLGGYYSGQFIKDKTQDYKAYGYLHSEGANSGDEEDILHDFNREKDVSFTMNTPNLPVTNHTYDSYNYTGQGISGDFRPHRNHVGTVFDPLVKNFPSINANVGIELGAGNTAHGGVNVELTFSRTKTGKWKKSNKVESVTKFRNGNNSAFEGIYFKQGGEKTAETDMAYFDNIINGFTPVRFGLQAAGADAFCTKELTTKYGGSNTLSYNARSARVRRNESINVLTGTTAAAVGLEKDILDYPVNQFESTYSNSNAPTPLTRSGGTYISSHHISEITTLRDDGARYVYGIPAYNNLNKESTFAIEVNNGTINYATGQAPYSAGSDNSTGNSKSLDQYFNSQTLPGYAHAFLLNAVLSSDYVDRTQNGPTKDDLGKYTKFNYSRVHQSYKWRSPYTQNQGSLNQALYSSEGPSGDDKASYTYGEKEIWYLHSIETKNYIAVFELNDNNNSPRLDGLGVLNEDGGQDASQKLNYLKEIRLYTRQELIDKGTAAVPLKTVHLEYDYSLCPGIENNVNHGSQTNNGKLTLKKVWFTYQNSKKGKLSPYEFFYADNNQDGSPEANFGYNPKSYDRWGNYKPNNPPLSYLGTNHSSETYLLTSEFPYTSQVDSETDSYAAAWNLTKIKLPSGAEIKVNYESDDYAYVQDRKAMEMHTIFGASNIQNPVSNQIHDKLYDVVVAQKVNYNHMFVNLSQEEISELTAITNLNERDLYIRNKYFRDEYGRDIDYLYFKYLVNVERSAYSAKKMEYISGYAKIDFSFTPTLWQNSKLQFTYKEVSIYDNASSGQTTNPVTMAAINFVRRYMPKVAFDNNQDPYSTAGSNLLGLLNGMKAAYTPIIQFFKGGLANALLLSNACQDFIPERSFVRLYSSDQFKKGGGCRVKQLTLNDNWSTQAPNSVSGNSIYGQIFDYVTKDPSGKVISSGVASYEPLIGGDENPFKKPVFFEEKHILAPDDDFYQEEPYGEAMFPGPSVGYSRVVVRNLERINGAAKVSRHATGAVVHEYYTAKDFPTMTDRTDIKKERHKPNPVAKFLKFFVRDFMTTSQGYQVILNDMHGKPKAQWVYKEADPALLSSGKALDGYYGNNYISGIEYKYKRNLDQVNNDVKVINKNGQVSDGLVGVDYDMVVDTRESETVTRVGTTQGNLEGFFLAMFPGLVPTIFPGYSQEKVRYRSSVVTKVLYRYGLLEETIAHDNGSSVSTKNKLWDAETGEVVLTETINNFSDPIYSLTYPAHWAYNRMGSAYKNIGASSNISGGNVVNSDVLIVGDELHLSGGVKGWVKQVTPTIQIVGANGALLDLNAFSSLIVTRSGNRNQQNLPVTSLVSLVNPISNSGSLLLNSNSKVINASAAEFKDDWGIFCNCGVSESSVTNPFLTGQKGIWRPSASYVYLTGRDQSNKNNNTNIRKDGAYINYVPYWTPNSAAPYNWNKTSDPTWQVTTKMMMYSPYGFEIENKDALGRSSSALYGYGNSLPIAVSSNARYSQIGFDGFEDYDYNNPCEDDHFSYIKYEDGNGVVLYNKLSNNYISKTNSQNQKYSHSGRKSIKVEPGAIIKLNAPIKNACDPRASAPIVY